MQNQSSPMYQGGQSGNPNIQGLSPENVHGTVAQLNRNRKTEDSGDSELFQQFLNSQSGAPRPSTLNNARHIGAVDRGMA